MIRIKLMPDQSQEEAARLLRDGGTVSSYEVLQKILPLIFDAQNGKAPRDDVIFWRVSPDGSIREFTCRTIGCAIEQNMEIRPSADYPAST